jgi:hypothetical protein
MNLETLLTPKPIFYPSLPSWLSNKRNNNRNN